LWKKKGARNLDELFKPTYKEVLGPPDSLTSAFPELVAVLRPEFKTTARCQAVSGLNLSFDDTAEPLPCLMWENTLLLDSAQLAQLSRAVRLRLLVNEVAAAGWLQHESAEALQILGDARVDERRAEVARGVSLAERLLRAVGGRPEPLRKSLGDLEGMDFVQQCKPIKLAELTLAQLGSATLSILKDTLEAEGLKPPARWNTAESRAFVASIGFPDEYAASPESRREPEEYISGPIELPPLHDFQEEVLTGIRTLVASGTSRRRAVVSLPTGGGKTRVTVQAAVLRILKPEDERRSVVWVAQTDELCEQAVQAFRQVWLNLGAQRTDLRIVRLWGGNSNPSIQEPDKPVVVVASIQTLNSRMGTDGLVWLQKPGLVVVDECHHAITPSYTSRGADGGVDLTLRKDGRISFVQCKQWKVSSVGAPIIREMFGLLTAEKADEAIIVTSGNFTRDAESFADGKPIRLVDGPQLLTLVQSVQTRYASTEPETSEAPAQTAAPACPNCGKPMVLRTARRGSNAGRQFWGCSAYSACKGIRELPLNLTKP
jgi:hypothetical protein